MNNKNCKQIIKYLIFSIITFFILDISNIQMEIKIGLTVVLGTLQLFFDYYVPTYSINLK